MVMKDAIYGITIRDALDTTALAVDFLTDTFKSALVTDTYTPDENTHDFFADVTNEVTGTNYTSGGAALATVTWAVGSSFLKLDGDDTAWASATISSIEGRVLLDDTLASDPLILATDFGATYSVTAGTFTILESANGLWRLALA